MLSRSDEELPFTAEDVKWAVLVAVCERKSRGSRRQRKKSSILEDCMAALGDPTVCPAVNRFRVLPVNPIEIKARAVCAEARVDFERIEPLVDQLLSAMARR